LNRNEEELDRNVKVVAFDILQLES
jgi:DNA ligase 1